MTEPKAVTILDILNYYHAEIPDNLDEDSWTPMRCPFHDDLHASAGVNVSEGIFNCHACDIRGDVLNVVARWEEMGSTEEPDRRAADEWISRIFGGSAQRIPRAANDKPEPKPNAWREALFG